MATYSAHIDCPHCEAHESITYRYHKHFIMYFCDECETDWEEDFEGDLSWHHKSVGFAGAYTGHSKTRSDYEKHFGPIPRGWELHHIDHNSQNNDLGNLISIPSTIHAMIHSNPAAYGSKASIRALLSKSMKKA